MARVEGRDAHVLLGFGSASIAIAATEDRVALGWDGWRMTSLFLFLAILDHVVVLDGAEIEQRLLFEPLTRLLRRLLGRDMLEGRVVLCLLHILMAHLILHASSAKTACTSGALVPKVPFRVLHGRMHGVLTLLLLVVILLVLPLEVGLVVGAAISIHTVGRSNMKMQINMLKTQQLIT